MITIDTNVLVRLITLDDPAQVAKARAVIVAEGAFVQDTVILETVWVLRRAYGYTAGQINKALLVLADTATIETESPDRIVRAVAGVESGLGFEDAFHLAGCSTTSFATFDEALIKRASRAFKTPKVFSPELSS